jgi:hypothetical protein
METKMTEIYELSPNVADALLACAEGNNTYTFAVIEAREDDPPERKRILAAEASEINDLINMDLLSDVSYKFHDQIKACLAHHGFGYKVVAMTEPAILMFSNTKHRKSN